MQSSEVVFDSFDSPSHVNTGIRSKYQRKQLTKLKLRFDYTYLERLSSLAKHIETTQNDCSMRRQALYRLTNGAGMGSELHTYGMTMCVVVEMQNVRLRTVGQWIYNDKEKCSDSVIHGPLMCYFPQAEPICPNITQNIDALPVDTFDIRYNDLTRKACPHITRNAGGYSNVRAATTEYMFTRVSDIVQTEGERQLNILFHGNNRTFTPKVPKDLITVHIRWGDKLWEMKLITIDLYIEAVQQILDKRQEKKKKQKKQQTGSDGNESIEEQHNNVHIFLATEDPIAYEEFMLKKPKHWQVYIDQYYIEMLPFRQEHGQWNVHVEAAEGRFQGRNGLIALGSLLVAMEANDFVLTTASNWSRLINEIRKNILDPRCNNCTSMIDLLHDEL